MKIKIFLLLLLAFSGCTSMNTKDFKHTSPQLILEEYFTKNISGRGAFFGRSGKLGSRMTVKTSGEWDGKILTLKEDLRYESGETHHRTFYITKLNEHEYEVRCDEIVGVGRIESYGNTLHWTYYLKEQSKQVGGVTLAFDDWMFLSEDNYIINRATVSKFGLTIGDVFLSLGQD